MWAGFISDSTKRTQGRPLEVLIPTEIEAKRFRWSRGFLPSCSEFYAQYQLIYRLTQGLPAILSLTLGTLYTLWQIDSTSFPHLVPIWSRVVIHKFRGLRELRRRDGGAQLTLFDWQRLMNFLSQSDGFKGTRPTARQPFSLSRPPSNERYLFSVAIITPYTWPS